VKHLSPWFISSARAVVAATLAVIALSIARLPRPTRAEIRPLIAIAGGVVLGFPMMSTLAVRYLPSAHASITSGLLPLATVGLAMVTAGERPSRRWWLGTMIGVTALVIFAIGSSGTSISVGHPLMVLAVLLAAIGYVNGGVLSRTRPGWWVISWGVIIGLPVTVPVSLAFLPTNSAPTKAWVSFAYLGVVSMYLGFFAWYAGLARVGIARGSQIQLLQPIQGFLLAWLLLGEHLSLGVWAAGLAVVAGLAIGRRRT
jgi:drug/metabolite transporter (DMT)-like permease